METSFGPKTSVLSILTGYLLPKDITQIRQVNKFSKQTSENISGTWKSYVQSFHTVLDCPRCHALRNPRYMEHCPLCEKDVCLEHLVKCTQCLAIYCNACVGFCC